MKRMIARIIITLSWAAIFVLLLYSSKLQKIIPAVEKQIDIFTWSDIFNPELIEQFEKETNIKVKLHYYTSNEELLVKLKATKGKGYDLIVPSDYAVKILAENRMLKVLDHSKVPAIATIHPLLTGHDFDPSLKYSLPFQWDIMGFGINKSFFKNHTLKASWDQIFNKQEIFYKIAMVNDPIEAFNLAAKYLFPQKTQLTPNNIHAIKDLLIEQKKWVEAYTDYRSSYLLATGNCPLAVSMSSYIWRLTNRFDFVDFIFPTDAPFVSIENFAIPKASIKEDLVYQFINYIFQPHIYAQNCNYFYLLPVIEDVIPLIDMNDHFRQILLQLFITRPNFNFFRHNITEKQIREIWVEVKVS